MKRKIPKRHWGVKVNEVKAYTVTVGNIDPLNKKSRAAVKIIKKLDGLLGITPVYPRGTLIIFESENAAKRAKNFLKTKGIQTGHNICECYVTSGDKKGGGQLGDI